MKISLAATIMLGTVLAVSTAPAQVPEARIDNGILHAKIYLPDPVKGYYRGTRFDWSGVIGELTFAGHSFYGPWFTKMQPGVRDYIFDGDDITAGTASAITGPAESFATKDKTPLGFSSAQPGHTFVKIGIGALRKPDDEKFNSYRTYDIVNGGKWKIKTSRNSVEFTQTLVDGDSGYGYIYTKTLRLLAGKPVLVIEHTLKNTGRLSIDTNVFNHNFLVLDHQPAGPDFSIRMPFTITPTKAYKTELGTVEGNRISYRRQLEGREVFTVQIGGYGASASDNQIWIENSRIGAGVKITGDRPLEEAELWSIRSTIAMEPYVHLNVPIGKTTRWSYTYQYYTLPTKP